MPTPQLLLEHLRKHGQLLDREIANAIKIPLAEVREALAELSAQHEISNKAENPRQEGHSADRGQRAKQIHGL